MLSRSLTAAVAVALCALLSVAPTKKQSQVTLEVLPSPLVLKILGQSQLDFVADLFWIRMANMAGRANTAAEYGALLPIGNLIADLAPKFQYSYYVGGVLAPVRKGRTTEYDNLEGAVELMKRGIKELPNYIRLHVQLAYTQLEMQHDSTGAAATLQTAAKNPKAPPFISTLAARLLAQSGQYADARTFVQTFAQSENPEIRADFEQRLRLIDLEEILTKVEDAGRRYAEANGHITTSVEELVRTGFLSETPVDPFGGTIELTVTGARSTIQPQRMRAFVPPGE